MSARAKMILLWVCAAACALPWITPPAALFAGIVFALFIGNTDAKRASRVQKYLLQASVVGLGFGIQLAAVIKAGSTGVATTALTLVATMGLGLLLAHLLSVERTVGHLVSTGTAICGGSAIAAMGPVLGAKPREMSIALGCVFVLNAVALFTFPAIGHWAGLTPTQFGYWAAIAIHDTSSVVGAAARYSAEALEVAVPVKLARALWILPMVAIAALVERQRGTKATIPWFVLWFIVASAIASLLPQAGELYRSLVLAAKAGLAVTLFLIGSSLSREHLAEVGWRPFALGIALWVVVSVAALFSVSQNWFPS